MIRRSSGGGGCHLQEVWILGALTVVIPLIPGLTPSPPTRADGEALRTDGVWLVGEQSHLEVVLPGSRITSG